jgi:hypothetical protein
MMMTSTYPATFFNTNENLIDFGVTENNIHSQHTTTTDLILLDDNNMSFAATPSTQTSCTSTMVEAVTPPRDTESLEVRDDVFVNSLPAEIIEEQKRIYAQIQSRNNRSQTTSNNNNNGIVPYNPTNYQQQFENKFTNLPDNDTTSTSLPVEVHPQKYQMKDARKVKTAASATTGAVVGGLLFGPAWPVGAVAGAAVGGYAGKVISRKGERKQQVKHDKTNFNKYTAQGIAAVQSENVAFA